MSLLPLTAMLSAGLFVGAAPSTWDLGGYRAQPGLSAVVEGEALVVQWTGAPGQELRARFAATGGTPTIRELAVREGGGAWAVLGRDLVPEFRVTTGVRRTGRSHVGPSDDAQRSNGNRNGYAPCQGHSLVSSSDRSIRTSASSPSRVRW